MTTDPTTLLKLSRPEFNSVTWHDDVNRNMAIIDSAMASIGVLANIVGVWENSTAYAVGERVASQTGIIGIWECLIAHTSPVTGSFLEDLVANPTRWRVVSGGLVPKGAWVTGTVYLVNDLVFEPLTGRAFIAIEDHTSGVLDDDVAADLWYVFIDFSALAALVDFSSFANTLLAAEDAAEARGILETGRLVSNKSANYTTVAADNGTFLSVSAFGAARTITLLAAATAGHGFEVIVKKSDSSTNTVTIDGDGSETIGGATTYVLRLQYNAVRLRCDGTNWHLVESHLPPEWGSNANGEYIRYSNGWQVCWGYVKSMYETSVRLQGAATFPAAFVTSAGISVTAIPSTRRADNSTTDQSTLTGTALRESFLFMVTKSTTSILFYLDNSTGAAVSGDQHWVSWTATGWWF